MEEERARVHVCVQAAHTSQRASGASARERERRRRKRGRARERKRVARCRAHTGGPLHVHAPRGEKVSRRPCRLSRRPHTWELMPCASRALAARRKKVPREAEKMNSCASRAHTSNFHFARGSGSGAAAASALVVELRARFREIYVRASERSARNRERRERKTERDRER